MLRFETNGKKDCTDVFVSVDFGTNLPSDNSQFYFRWHANDPHFAYLLARHFQKRLEDAIKHAHCRAYTQGYADGRQHKAQKTYFDKELGLVRKPAH